MSNLGAKQRESEGLEVAKDDCTKCDDGNGERSLSLSMAVVADVLMGDEGGRRRRQGTLSVAVNGRDGVHCVSASERCEVVAREHSLTTLWMKWLQSSKQRSPAVNGNARAGEARV